MTDYYKLLGILPNATTEEIKKSYRQLALKHHPDLNPGNVNSEAFFKNVTEAYNVLSDPEKRATYNEKWNRFRQATRDNSERNKGSKYDNESNITPNKILLALRVIKNDFISNHSRKTDANSLYSHLNDLFSIANIDALLAHKNMNANREIIREFIACCEALPPENIEQLLPKVIKLAGSDKDSVSEIVASKAIANMLSLGRTNKLVIPWETIKSLALSISIIIIFIGVLMMKEKSVSSSYSSDPSIGNSDGDLTNTFLDQQEEGASPSVNSKSNSAYIPALTAEQIVQQEKNKLISEGWTESDVNNGPMPSCYNFTPKRSNIDNYLEVHVGGGTDVAIKVMNLKTDKCIRYVFINSGSIYKISNIPEGVYYLKIAYGKDWLSKVVDGQCIGRFVRNPMYEKGDDLMDFNLQYTSDGYRIPSFELKLDVIATKTVNNFVSQEISEGEFNR